MPCPYQVHLSTNLCSLIQHAPVPKSTCHHQTCLLGQSKNSLYLQDQQIRERALPKTDPQEREYEPTALQNVRSTENKYVSKITILLP